MRVSVISGFICLLMAYAPASAASSARGSLAVRLPASHLIDVPIVDAFDFLRDVGGANINVDWKSLEAVNVSKTTLINLNLHEVQIGKVLEMILNEAGPGELLSYYIDGNVIEITSRNVADSKMITVVYDVEDLILANTPFNPTISNSGGGPQISGSGGSGGGASSFGSSTPTANTSTVQQSQDALIKLIETIIRPEIWRDNGGPASMAILNGHLIVTAPRSVQEAIGGPVE